MNFKVNNKASNVISNIEEDKQHLQSIWHSFEEFTEKHQDQKATWDEISALLVGDYPNYE